MVRNAAGISVIPVEVVMITIEVHNQLVTWPDDFAIIMMRYYKKHEVPFVLRWRHPAAMFNDSGGSYKHDEVMSMITEKRLSTPY